LRISGYNYSKETTMRTRSKQLLACVVGLGLLAIAGCEGPAVVPASYKEYVSGDKSFKLQVPAQWTTEDSARPGNVWATFKSGGAKIAVETSAAGSVIGDIAGGPMGGMVGLAPAGGAQTQAPVDVVHQKEKAGFESDEGVKEGEPAPVTTACGEGRKSEFTGSRTIGPRVRGYRVTVVGPQYRVRLVCECPVTEWDKLKPAFDKAIESLGRGS
jgi:hypothetical protein